MKLVPFFLVSCVVIGVSSCDISGNDNSGNNYTEIAKAKEKAVVAEDEYYTLLDSDNACESEECIAAKKRYEDADAELRSALHKGTFKNSFTVVRTSDILTINDSVLTYSTPFYFCDKGMMDIDSDRTVIKYKINNGILDLNEDNYWSCSSSKYRGTANSLLGSWNFDQEIINNSMNDCRSVPEAARHTGTLVISNEKFIETDTYEFNCYVDDMNVLDKNDSTDKKIDCDTYTTMYYGIKFIRKINWSAESNVWTKTWEYKGISCTRSHVNYFDNSVKPNCTEQERINKIFDSCQGNLLEKYCEDYPKDENDICSDYCSDYPDAPFCKKSNAALKGAHTGKKAGINIFEM